MIQSISSQGQQKIAIPTVEFCNVAMEHSMPTSDDSSTFVMSFGAMDDPWD